MGISHIKEDGSLTLAGVRLKNPVTTASGTFNFDASSKFYDPSELGAVTTKGVSAKPWAGNKTPRIAESPSGMLNSIGLQNPGAEAYISGELKSLKEKGATVIANVCGHTEDEYIEAAAMLNFSAVDMLEINVSCPNLSEGGLSFGTDAGAVSTLVRKIKSVAEKPIIVKLSPNVTDICEIAKAAESSGADALSLINTLVGMRIDTKTGRPILANETGGLSGPAIMPVALAALYRVSKAVQIPIIGMGGISSGKDALEFLLAGASAVAVGTAALIDPAAPVRIAEELKNEISVFRHLAGESKNRSKNQSKNQLKNYPVQASQGPSLPCKRPNAASAFIKFLTEAGALSFGDFTTKSGRKTNYFINAGAFKTGEQIARLGEFYAEEIVKNINAGKLPKNIDIIFGPAYKGIPLAVTVCIALSKTYGIETAYCFNRKEKKDHGEGGDFVGKIPRDKDKVLIIDDVLTAGTAFRETLPMIRGLANVDVVGLMVSVDRMEKGIGSKPASEEIKSDLGVDVFSIVTAAEIPI